MNIRFEKSRIGDLRKNLDLTTLEFSRKLTASRQSIEQWEAGDCKPTMDSLVDMCNTYNVSPVYFFVYIDLKKNHNEAA